ncbi:hypothetical protein LTR62_008421 [Meristemomyces frigidus]|uniref:DNA replication checkpoint mediator MRC1 domain-containing protein n=1 Tax=Meristemomyces frigidus TaxID=1508187 RepID=A0AAN7YH49_9PEZI|nr:hypothetical protein LTR62_008421 [Meristemomyces frigidus]
MNGSSPMAATGSPMTMELTPRSKVAKMLADIDNAATPSPVRHVNKAQANEDHHLHIESIISRSPLHGDKPSPVNANMTGSVSDVDDDSDDMDIILRRPQGQAARRMMGMRDESPTAEKQMRSSPQHRDAPMDDEDLHSVTPGQARTGKRALSGSPVGSAKSAGLFVSPARSSANNASDDDFPNDPFVSKERLVELVAQKHQKRLRNEKEANRESLSLKRKRAASPYANAPLDLPDGMLDSSEHEIDAEVDQLMSDAARPMRKASKRALLEMERETQRIARQQALAHQMKVKRKFTTSDLLARFSVRPQGRLAAERSVDVSSASSAPSSDGAEPKEPVSTPPSSPPPSARPTPLDKQTALVEQGALSKLIPVREDSIASLAQRVEDEEELPEIADVLRTSQFPKESPLAKKGSFFMPAEQGKRGLKLARFGKTAAKEVYAEDSDEDLDIIAPLPKHLLVFDKIKPKDNKGAADSRALHALRHLSHAGAYEPVKAKAGKGSSRPAVGANVLQAQLVRRAKEQARALQQDRIEELRAKGIVIQTTEEREREQEVFENLFDKARLEAVELRKAEKAAAKEGGADGNPVDVSEDEDEDEEYVGSGSDEDEAEWSASELGVLEEAAEESDDEAEADGEELEEQLPVGAPADGESADVNEQVVPTAAQFATPAPRNRKPRQSRIVLDEEDTDSNDEVDGPFNLVAADLPVEDDDPFAAFCFNANAVPGNELLSPAQAFQATMQTPTQATQEDSFDLLRMIAPPSVKSSPPTVRQDFKTPIEETQSEIVPGSQSQLPESQRIDLGWETHLPGTPTLQSLTRGQSGLNETPVWEPTQDAGLPSPWIGRLQRELTLDSVTNDYETQETVRLRVSESPAAARTPAGRRGRLMRRQATVLAHSSDNEDEPAIPAKVSKKDAFREMARRRREDLTVAERADVEQEMKAMMEEAAEESDDEYAGLGGDDFVAPETEADREMIDSSEIDVNERQLAQLFAENQRQKEEEETSKLYKDLTTGALRRKQAGAWGLDEDEDEVATRRRQMRQREEARKRKLLLQDDKIAGLAQGKQSRGKDAFLKAIADDDDGDNLLGLFDQQEDSQALDESQIDESQLQQLQAAGGALQEISGNEQKVVKVAEDDGDRARAKQRRTQANAFRKPTNMLEVRESLSFLLDEPIGAVTDAGSRSDEDQQSDYGLSEEDDDAEMEDDMKAEEARQNDGGFAPNPKDFDTIAMPPPRLPASQRRTQAPADVARKAVVDRLTLKRSSSNTSSNTAHNRSAWAAPASTTIRVPSLLRRATTDGAASSSSANAYGVSTSNGSTSNLSRENSGSGVKMGGSKKSSLAYQGRAEERRAIVEASARRREENTRKIAEMRRSGSAGGVLGKGLMGVFE